jgi:hypothetical protein
MSSFHRITHLFFAITCAMVVMPPVGAAGERPEESAPPVAIEIEIADRAELELLTRLVSIDDVHGHEVRATATPTQLEMLEAKGWQWRVAAASAAEKSLDMCGVDWVQDSNRSWSCYPTYQQYEALLHTFAADHPDLCRLVDLGPTSNLVRPHRLWAVVLSDNPDEEEAEPEVLLTSTIHGDETTGFILMLRLIDDLIRNYGDDSEITTLVDETEIWINPNANPDGTYYGGDDTVSDAIRFYTTATGAASEVDGNRNFPDFDDGDHPDGYPWLPETETMMALAEEKTFVLSVNFHGGAEVVNYPWDTVERRHPDNDWFRDLARNWADLAQSDSPGGYMTDQDNGITNGWDWYTVAGGRQDFMTFFHGGREVTIEISETKLLSTDELDDLWSWNRRALLDFISHAHQGIRGIVTGSRGEPLAATVEVIGVDRPQDGSMIRTDEAVGDFHRLLLPGLYDLRIEASGHHPREVYGIAVIDGELTEIEVELNPMFTRRPWNRVAPNPTNGSGRPQLQE